MMYRRGTLISEASYVVNQYFGMIYYGWRRRRKSRKACINELHSLRRRSSKVSENAEMIARVYTVIAATTVDEFSARRSNGIVSKVCVLGAFPDVTFVEDKV